jgi:phage gp36-like protein
MNYLTLNDFYLVIQPDELVDVVGEVEEENDEGALKLATLEVMAMHEVQGYLYPRYDTAVIFTADTEGGRPAIIVQFLVDIVLYHAYSAVHPNNVPELREKRYDNAVDYLEKIMKGFVAPQLPIREDEDDDPSGPLRYGSSKPKEDQYF